MLVLVNGGDTDMSLTNQRYLVSSVKQEPTIHRPRQERTLKGEEGGVAERTKKERKWDEGPSGRSLSQNNTTDP
jgi:hypothetical protein